MRDLYDGPLIFAVDDPDGTYYVLCRHGHMVAAADWPHPLEAAYPDARRGGTIGSGRDLIPSGEPALYVTRQALYDELVERLKATKGNTPFGG